MTEPTTSASGGRRVAVAPRARISLTVALAVLLPLLSVAGAALVSSSVAEEVVVPPHTTPLSRASVACPSGQGGGRILVAGGVSGAEGDVAVGLGADSTALPVGASRTAVLADVSGPVIITGENAVAPGLLATRVGTGELAATTCPAPLAEQWFTGVGGGVEHSSELELVNPDSGPAIADVTVFGRDGVLDVPAVRGVRVPGGRSVRLDLAQLVPTRDELAIQVSVSRGRLVGSVLDRVDELGAGDSSADWLAAQAEPATSNVLLGLPRGEGQRTLVLANGGDDETRVTLKVITEASVLAPVGVEEIRVPPQSVTSVPLDGVLSRELSQGALGLSVESTAPITATLRSFVAGDLSHATAAEPVSSSTLLRPQGSAQLLMAGAARVGSAVVVVRDERGGRLLKRRIEIPVGRALSLTLPPRGSRVEVESTTPVRGVVLVTGRGAVALALRELVLNGLVPDVRPASP